MLNKEIETISVEIKNIMMHNTGGDGFRGRGGAKGGRAGSKSGRGNFKGRKGDSSNNEEVRKMGGNGDRNSKPFNKKGGGFSNGGKRKRVD
jgi:hypothetical protein